MGGKFCNAEILSDTDSDEDRSATTSRPHANLVPGDNVEWPRRDGQVEPPPPGARISFIGSDNIRPMDRLRRTGDIVAGANFGPRQRAEESLASRGR